jgi:hypothetical protein
MSTKRNTGSIIGGAILIVFGILALLGQLFRHFDFWGIFWPFILIGIGVMFFIGMFLGGKAVAGLAIPGAIISVIGLQMFLQNLTGYWETWSYGWTVILFSVGLGIFIMGAYNGNTQTRASGLKVMKIGAILFVIFGAFFELIFSAGGVRQLFFPAALILLGLYLVVTRSGLLPRRNKESFDQPQTSPQNPPQQ